MKLKNKNFIKNKKAFFAEVTIDVFAILAIFIIFIIFIIVFSISNDKIVSKIDVATNNYDCNIILTQILKTPIEVDGYKTDFATYIAFAYYDENYIEDLENQLNDLILFIQKESNYEKVVLYSDNLELNDAYLVNPHDKKGYDCIINIPTLKNDELIKIYGLLVKND
ncbi:MAG: hypothetical protein ACLFPJ_03615 [Candidatus Woesearchaeota archaeon]